MFRSVQFLSWSVLFAPTLAQGGAELFDYLVQDVCVDGNNNAIAGDPASCGSHRNINIGERLTYIHFDRNRDSGATSFSYSSIPVHAQDNTEKVLIVKSGQGNFDSSYTFSFDPSRDGYDLIDQTFADYASIIRTSDGGCYDQMFSSDGSINSITSRAGGWPLFPYAGNPSSWPQSSSTDVTTYHVQITQGLSNPACGNGHAAGVTFWNAPTSYAFETGKVLTAIKQYHFASSDLSSQNNALELYYFTKEYGATRWEAWTPQSQCFAENGSDAPICHPENPSTYPIQGWCSELKVSTTGIPGLDTWGGQYWNDGYVDINYQKTAAGQ